MKLADITSVYRSKLVAKTFKSWLSKDDHILDIGCGTGVVADELRKSLKINVEGCDIEKYLIRNIPFKMMTSFSKIPYKNLVFNSSMFNDVLHHTDFENQKQLIKDAFRVSSKVLIFEIIPSKTGKVADLLINKIHNSRMNIPYSYRTPEDWQKLFNKLGLYYQFKEVRSPFWYPFKHIAFKLTFK